MLSNSHFIVASPIKKSLSALVAFELGLAGVVIGSAVWLRRSEKSRHYLYTHFPTAANIYYWAEDSVSFGQKVGTRLRLSDLKRWTQSEETETD